MPQRDQPTLEAGRLPETKPAQRRRAPARAAIGRLPLHTVYDLLLVAAGALLAPLLVLLPIPPLLRAPFGLALVLLAPGYAFTAALFARRDSLDGVTRAGLSFGLSLALVPLLALVLDALPWGIRPLPVAFVIALWVLTLSGVAALRRSRLLASGNGYTPPRVALPRRWTGPGWAAPPPIVLGAAALVGVIAIGALALSEPDPTARLTEFYVLGAQGQAEGYPREAQVGEELRLHVGISNQEGEPVRYRVEVRQQDRLLNRIGPLLIEHGRSWEGALSFTVVQPEEEQQIDMLLFRDDQPAPYRRLRLWLNVRPSAP